MWWEILVLLFFKGGGVGEGFDVIKSGDLWVGFVGFLFVGKFIFFNKFIGIFFEVCC